MTLLARALLGGGALAGLCLLGEAAAAAAAAAVAAGSPSALARALIDSSVHGAVGAATWALAVGVALAPGPALPWERRALRATGGAARADDADKGSVAVAVGAAVEAAFGGVARLLLGGSVSSPAPPELAPGAAAPLDNSSDSVPSPPTGGVRWPALAAAVASAFVVACALDADHFLAARSLRLVDATRLPTRPFGHAVAFVAASSLAAAVLTPHPAYGLLLAAAWGSHQLRDALRRGLWLWPAGSTPPLSLPTYAGGCVAVALACGAALRLASARAAGSAATAAPPALTSPASVASGGSAVLRL
jgi:hypothetical protein